MLKVGTAALAGAVLLELALRLFVLPHYWRPLLPLGATTSASQEKWLERQREELEGRSEPDGIGCFDAELGWAYRPGSSAAAGRYTIHAGGWRGPRDYAPETPPGITRLAAFGESFTFCHEVADGETWEARLEALEPRFEVPNFGVGGYGTDQALLVAERRLPSLDADVVLVGLLLENIGRNVTRYRPRWVPQSESPVAKPRFVLTGAGLELVPLPFQARDEYVSAVESGAVLEILREREYWLDPPLPAWLSWSAIARLATTQRAYARRAVRAVWLDGGEPVATTLALLKRFRERAREAGARDAVVLIFPAKPDLHELLEDGKYWGPLLAALEREGAPFLDLSDALTDSARQHGPVGLYGPGHLSARGNEVVARALRDWLRGWLPDDRPR